MMARTQTHAVAETAPPATDDDRALAARVAAGERSAFEQLMRRCNARLYRLARAVLRDDAEAEDALQEAYLQAYRSIRHYRGEAMLSTWLSRLVLNECFARRRKDARRENILPIRSVDEATEPDETIDEAHTPEEFAMRSEMRSIVQRELDELPEDYRVVFVLRTVEEMSVEEVAQCLGVPEATVRTRHFRARARLRAALADAIDLAERDVYEFGGWRCDRVVAAVLARIDEAADRNGS